MPNERSGAWTRERQTFAPGLIAAPPSIICPFCRRSLPSLHHHPLPVSSHPCCLAPRRRARFLFHRHCRRRSCISSSTHLALVQLSSKYGRRDNNIFCCCNHHHLFHPSIHLDLLVHPSLQSSCEGGPQHQHYQGI